jgi:hypothetical protein
MKNQHIILGATAIAAGLFLTACGNMPTRINPQSDPIAPWPTCAKTLYFPMNSINNFPPFQYITIVNKLASKLVIFNKLFSNSTQQLTKSHAKFKNMI